MKVLVTGANGFIGSAIVRTLLGKGFDVRALVRKNSDCRNLHGLPVALVHGDLTEPASLGPALDGCEALFHVGALYRLWSPNSEQFYRTNVEGTRNIMLAALSAGVGRVVYTSSIATLGTAGNQRVADERTVINRKVLTGHYKRSKVLAEYEVFKLIKTHALPAVITNPTAPVGPGDIKPTPTGRLIRDAAAGRIPAYVNTGLNIVHVDDVAEGHYLAFKNGEVGEKYILGGENISLKQILESVAAMTERSPPMLRISPNLVLPLAYLAEFWARLTSGNEPMMTVAGVKLSKQVMYFSSEKARHTLGYQPRQAIQALEDAVAWFRRESVSERADPFGVDQELPESYWKR